MSSCERAGLSSPFMGNSLKNKALLARWVATFGFCCFASASMAYDRIPRQIQYQEGIYPYYQRNYESADTACASVASQLNTWTLANPNGSQNSLRLNPRATIHPSYGLGCTFDHQLLMDVPPQWHAGDVQPDRFQQGAILIKKICPTGYVAQSPPWANNFEFCAIIESQTRECEMGNCPSKGKPVIVSVGMEIQSETDYSKRAGSALEFTRYYRSSPMRQYIYQFPTTRLGYLWTDTYSRSVRLAMGSPTVPVPNIVTVKRPTGHEVMFAGSTGSWAPEGDIADRLTQQLDGSGNTTGWLYKNASDDSMEAYDANGRLLSITSRAGVTQTMTYSTSSTSSSIAPGAGYLIQVTDSFGNSLSFTYDAQLRISTVTEPGIGTTTYGYNGNSILSSVTHPDGTTRGYLYNESAHMQNISRPFSLTGIVDENNSRFATIKYNDSGRVASTRLAGDVDLTSFTYAGGGLGTTVVDALGASRVYSFTRLFGRPKSTTIQRTCAGCTTATSSQVLDANGNVTSRTDFNGVVTTYVFDTSRNLETSRTEASGTPRARTITTAWHSTFRMPTSITEPNRTTTFTHDSAGNVLTRTITDTAVTPNVSRTWTYTYNGFGQVLTEDGPRTDVSDVTTHTYYSCTTGYQCGQLHTITNALGHLTTFNAYNAHGQPTQVTDANGLVTSLAYDARRRLTDRCTGSTLPSCSGGELTHLDYWPTGLLKKVTNPDASFIEYTYDAAHRLTQIKDGALNKVVYTLDNAGNRTAENTYDPSNALRRTHTRVFNTLNRLWKDVNAAGTAAVTTTFDYDNNGNQTTTNAPLSRNSTSLYDELNRLKQITDPASGVTLFGYDANDNLTSVTDPRSQVTSYTYSGFGELKAQTSPDTGLTTNTYDSGGNLDTSTDSRGAITDYGYDAANRVTSASFTLSGATDQTLSYTYDTGTNQKGQLTGASDANHALTWSYDARGRVTGKDQTAGGVTLSLGYGYNASGQLSSTTLPSGATISYGYNANGQPASLTLNSSTTILSSITYDPFGPITSWLWGNGSSANRAFDTDGKVTQVDNANGASLKNYAYDDAFRITGLSDAGDSALSWTYGYDALDRLNAASKTGTTQGWTYDGNGNRLTQTGSSPSTYTNSSTSNRVNSISGSLSRTYAYDAAGNTLSFAGATFTYNNRGRMASASNVGVTATYTYNALGQRIKRTAFGVTTLFAYDEAGHLIGEYSSSGALIQETVWLGDTPVATLRPNGSGGVVLYYVHADHLNTPRLITDTSNNIRWRWDSDPFGTTLPNENPASLGVFAYDLRFPGQQYDAVLGLNYNYFRDYDPAVGRYAESDPIGLGGGINTFSYAESDPSASADPLGLAVYRGPGNYYGDTPGPGGCESAVFAGDALVGWIPCPEVKYFADYSIRSAPGLSYGPNCPEVEDGSGYHFSVWDALWLMPQFRLGKSVGTAYASAFSIGRAARGAAKPLADITKKIKQFEGKSLRDQKSVYENLKNTYEKHLEKYGQTAGSTMGETNRMERELAAMREILESRGVTF